MICHLLFLKKVTIIRQSQVPRFCFRFPRLPDPPRPAGTPFFEYTLIFILHDERAGCLPAAGSFNCSWSGRSLFWLKHTTPAKP
jgi:hypothetical protein